MRVRLCAIVLSTSLLVPPGAAAQEAATPPATETSSPAPLTEPSKPQADVDAPAPVEAAHANVPEAPTPAGSSKVAPAPADKAQIVFFRPSKFAGGAIGFKVREGEQELGKLRSGNYFVHLAEPGTHEYTVHSETKDVLTMEVEEGETYYVQGTISMGVFAGRPNLSPSDETTFNGIADKLKLRE